MKNIFILFIILFNIQFCDAQSESLDDGNFPLSLLSRNFEYLNQGNELFEKHPFLKRTELNSIIGCIYLLNDKEEEIKHVALGRLEGIATQLFNEGTPVILISGMDSTESANKKNENLEDDNHIIYLSIAACHVFEAESKAQKIFNAQTMKLIAQKNAF
ncbi:hypothetical protein ACYE2N_04560 [Flavobacterium sp. MAHUQ-51]|uniref:hypothetical protein n=1 Tax=Flavobacterium sp. GCM10022190 TaxID=3252639 RepID=UPI0036133E19